MKTPLFFDYASTTPVDPRVAEQMCRYLTPDGVFGNPASRSHALGWEAEKAVEQARADVAALIGADPREIVWTSGATESDNLAIKGAAHFRQKQGKHVITVKTEHKAVLDTVRELERQGFEATYLDVNADGLVEMDALRAALREDTTVVSVHVGEQRNRRHSADGGNRRALPRAQNHLPCGRRPGPRKNPDGCERHQRRPGLALRAQGLRPEGNRRAVCPAQAAHAHRGANARRRDTSAECAPEPWRRIRLWGWAEAFRLAGEDLESDGARAWRALSAKLRDGAADIEEIYVNGDLTRRVPHNLNISFNFVEGESLIMAIKDVAVSSGSACTSASLEPSYVLRALGRNDELAHSSIRFSLGRFTTEEEVDFLVKLLHEKIGKLRELSPLWEMHKEGVDLNTVEWTAH